MRTKPYIISTSPVFGRVGAVPQKLQEYGWQVEMLSPPLSQKGISVQEALERMLAAAARAEFIVAGLAPVTEAFLAAAPRLKAVLRHGAGLDNVDIAAANARNIPVLNTPGANANAVAELALGGMFAFCRQIITCHNQMLAGSWQRFVGTELAGKTLGIVGLGSIGRQLALKTLALGMRVSANDRYPDMDFAARYGIKICELDELLGATDFVSLHTFGGADNHKLIGTRELGLMKSSACLINLARGEILDAEALHEALAGGKIAGAVLDSYEPEPPDFSHPLFKHKNIVCLPHIGGDTIEAQERVGLWILEDIQSLLAGERPERVANKEIYNV